MPASTLLTPFNTTVTEFRAWGSALSAAIAAQGWVKHTDTGQIDWTTAAAPAAGSPTGYEIWRMNDSLQATRPLFLKVEYGSRATTLPGVWVTIGFATNGTGTLLPSPGFRATISNRYQVTSGGAVNNSGSNSYINGDTSSLVAALWPSQYATQGTTGGGLFMVERTRDMDGTPNGDGVLLHVSTQQGSGSNGSATHILLYTTQYNQPAAESSGMSIAGTGLNSANSSVIGSTMYTYPWFTGFSPKMGGPSKWLVGMFSADLPPNTQFTMTHYGSSHTFLALSDMRGQNRDGSSVVFACAMRLS